ncbi:EpsG family protein [Croceimicrobium hydrocarbonivorans]|uniref:EpsG family protein n=1 Tax=Croceimicrobium hydrocarbonivorans TaxID=2761580 RepID=A0A7H0VGA7_9FLAO|nr:EpsG family protein [Croceimicrobium hydrocarbonivorans]QNR24755.1 EpsG family protein [Croceimicrobium hydrocarbonivorans]
MNKDSKKQGLLEVLLYIIAPFIGFYNFMVRLKMPSKLGFLVLAVQLGASFYSFSETADFNTYFLRLDRFDGSLSTVIMGLLSGKDVDILENLVYLFVTELGGNHQFMILVFIFINALLYYNLAKFVLPKVSYDVWWTYVLLLLLVFSIQPMMYINQFRFYTGSLLLVYGAYRYIKSGKMRDMWLFIVLAGLTHFSLFLFLAVPIFIKLIQKQNRFAYIILLSCLALGQSFDSILGSLDLGHSAFNDRIYDYTGEIGVNLRERLTNRVWYAVYLKKGILLVLTWIALRSLSKVHDLKQRLPLVIAIAFVSVIVLTFRFALSFRFDHLGIFLLSFILLQVNLVHSYRVWKLALLPLIAIFLGIQIKSFLGMLDTYWLFSNPIYELLIPKDGTLSEMINKT